MGTQKESFIELTERINRTTGGVSVYPFTSAVKGSPDPVAFLMVRVCRFDLHAQRIIMQMAVLPPACCAVMHSAVQCGEGNAA